MVPNPVRQVVARPILIPSLGRDIEVHVRRDKLFVSTSMRGIGMEDISARILIEDAVPGKIFNRGIDHRVIVIHLAAGDLFRHERHMEVIVEVAAMRRHPPELPPHAPPERFNLLERRARNRDKRDIMMFKMRQSPVNMIRLERTPDTTLLPSRPEHKVLNNQLAASVKQIRQRLLAVWSIEDVLLLNTNPRQLAPLL